MFSGSPGCHEAEPVDWTAVIWSKLREDASNVTAGAVEIEGANGKNVDRVGVRARDLYFAFGLAI